MVNLNAKRVNALAARRDAAAGRHLVALVTKAVDMHSKITGQGIAMRTRSQKAYATGPLGGGGGSGFAGVVVAPRGGPQDDLGIVTMYSDTELPSTYAAYKVSARKYPAGRLHLRYKADGTYVPGDDWTPPVGNPRWAAVQAAAREVWKPIKDTTYVHAGRLMPANVASRHADLTLRARRSAPQNGSRPLGFDRVKLQQLAQSHPHLGPRLRQLRNPFDTSRLPTGTAKLFAQQPRKADIRDMIAHWTTNSYKNVQAVRRADGAMTLATRGNRAVAIQKLDAALATYMRQFALRAPQLPPKVRNVATGSATPSLYRGVRLTPLQYVDFLQGKYADKGYMAFSRNPSYALQFVTRSATPNTVTAVFRLSAADVQRGTPWVWYASDVETTATLPTDHARNASYPAAPLPPGLAARGRGGGSPSQMPKQFHKNFVRGTFSEEFEVLLPPGRLIMRGTASPLRAPGGGNDTVLQFDVAYEPDRAATALWNGKRLVK